MVNFRALPFPGTFAALAFHLLISPALDLGVVVWFLPAGLDFWLLSHRRRFFRTGLLLAFPEGFL